jgi:hypothetical protein
MTRFLAFVLAAASATATVGQTPAPDQAGVRKAVETYLHGLKFSLLRFFESCIGAVIAMAAVLASPKRRASC